MKRILYTIPNVDTAGSGKALLNLARGVQKEGWDVHVLMTHTKGTLAEVFAAEFTLHEYPYVGKLRPISKLLRHSWKLAGVLKKIRPAVIHSFNYMAEYSEPLAARMARIPWIFTKKNMSWKGMSHNQWKIRSWLANAIIVQNTDMVKHFYPDKKNIHLVPRGVDTLKFKKSQEHAMLLEKKVTEEKRIIITVANLVPVKGVEDIIEAFSLVNGKYVNWELWILGDTELDSHYTAKLKNLSMKLGLEDEIVFLGKMNDIRPYLGRSELFVLPTRNEGRREGSPVAMLEAMAAGLVVFGSNVPGITDQLSNFNPHLFQPSNPQGLANVLEPFLANSREENRRKGQVFQGFTKEKFNVSTEVKKHLVVYQCYT